MSNYELTDYQWEQIQHLIPKKTSKCGKKPRDSRQLINAIIWVLRTGSPWCQIPECYGPWRTVYNNFIRWKNNGTIQNIFNAFTPVSETITEIQIDSTCVKAHQHSAGAKKRGSSDEAIGKSKGGLTTKIHMAVNEKGVAVGFILTPGNRNDITQTECLLEPIIKEGVYILADRGYESDAVLRYIASRSAVAVIPPKKNRKEPWEYDKEVYKHRNQVERFFQRLKNFRRIATRYDKLACSFFSLVQLASVLLLIPKWSPIE